MNNLRKVSSVFHGAHNMVWGAVYDSRLDAYEAGLRMKNMDSRYRYQILRVNDGWELTVWNSAL